MTLEPARNRRMAPSLLWPLPLAAVAAFVVLYGVSASLYPGGSRVHPTRDGFSVTENYWCDLLDARTYAGRVNPGRPFAIAATVVLSAGLAVLWWTVPALFPDARQRSRLVRLSGALSASLTPFIGTHQHDLAIRLAALFGAVGFVATMTALGARAGRTLAVVAWLALALILVNYVVWETGVGHGVLALIQKGAFAAFLTWVVFVTLRLRRGGPAAG
jgi:hypothetical protein